MKTKTQLQEIEQLQCIGCHLSGEVQKLIQKLSINEEEHIPVKKESGHEQENQPSDS